MNIESEKPLVPNIPGYYAFNDMALYPSFTPLFKDNY